MYQDQRLLLLQILLQDCQEKSSVFFLKNRRKIKKDSGGGNDYIASRFDDEENPIDEARDEGSPTGAPPPPPEPPANNNNEEEFDDDTPAVPLGTEAELVEYLGTMEQDDIFIKVSLYRHNDYDMFRLFEYSFNDSARYSEEEPAYGGAFYVLKKTICPEGLSQCNGKNYEDILSPLTVKRNTYSSCLYDRYYTNTHPYAGEVSIYYIPKLGRESIGIPYGLRNMPLKKKDIDGTPDHGIIGVFIEDPETTTLGTAFVDPDWRPPEPEVSAVPGGGDGDGIEEVEGGEEEEDAPGVTTGVPDVTPVEDNDDGFDWGLLFDDAPTCSACGSGKSR